jgi:hypothetical protein
MKNKTLNNLIFALLACFASIGLTALSILIRNIDRFYVDLIMVLIASFMDVCILFFIYVSIKSLFKRTTELSIWIAGLSTLLVSILWLTFKIYVFEGIFDVLEALYRIYISILYRLNYDVWDVIVTYFGITLFAATDVINQMVIFTLTIARNLIIVILIPLLPAILVFRDLLIGTEEYKFTKEEQEDFNELKL